MSGNNVSTCNYESFKILRGVPLCNPTNGQQKLVWYAIIQSIGNEKLRDPQNYIKTTPLNTNVLPPSFDSQIENQSITSLLSGSLIVDSTRIIIQNLVNNNFIDIYQEDAFCVFASNEYCPLVVDAPTSNPCVVNQPCTLPDGVLQFLGLIQIAPSCSWLGTGLVITVSPLNGNPFFSNCTYGNWCPFSFSIGNCNTQSATASLLYLTCPNISGYGVVYNANYANVRFTLLNKQKCATGGAKKACYLGVDSLDKSCFLVFFGQERLIGTVRILLISPIVDLKAIIWQPVFIVTTNTPLSLTCSN